MKVFTNCRRLSSDWKQTIFGSVFEKVVFSNEVMNTKVRMLIKPFVFMSKLVDTDLSSRFFDINSFVPIYVQMVILT